MVSSILAAIIAFFKAVPYFNRWFVKTPEQKTEDNESKSNQDEELFKKTGRPNE